MKFAKSLNFAQINVLFVITCYLQESLEVEESGVLDVEICDLVNYHRNSTDCKELVRKIESNDPAASASAGFSNISTIDADKFVQYLKGRSEFIQKFLLNAVVAQNWDKVNGTKPAIRKLEILAEMQLKKDYSEIVSTVTTTIQNGDIFKLIFSDMAGNLNISRIVLSPSALVSAIRNHPVPTPQLFPDFRANSNAFDEDSDFLVTASNDLITGLIQNDETSVNFMTSLVLGFMNRTADHISIDGYNLTRQFMETALGIMKPVSGGVGIAAEFQMYTMFVTRTLKEVGKGNWTALGEHIKKIFSEISIGEPGSLSELVDGKFGPQAQAFAVGLDIFIGLVDGILKSVEIVSNIDDFMPLSFGERFEEGIRAFLRYQPSQDVQILVGTKTGNNELVDYATRFLAENDNIQSLVLPSVKYEQRNCRKDITVKCALFIFTLFCDKICDQDFGMQDDSVVRLGNDVYDVYLDRARPDVKITHVAAKATPEVFCQPGNLDKSSGTESEVANKQFYCKNAIGIRRGGSSSSGALGQNSHFSSSTSGSDGINILSLGDGTDSAIGFGNASNLFVVGAGHKVYLGGNASDTFILVGGEFSGLLDGEGNRNSLIVADQFGRSGRQIVIDLSNGHIQGNPYKTATLRNFQSVIGRSRRSEHIICDCETEAVNGRGGSGISPGVMGSVTSDYDKIEIRDCPGHTNRNLHVQLNNFTIIQNSARSGKFMYDIPANIHTVFNISLDSLESAEHLFSFGFRLETVKAISVDRTALKLVVSENTGRRQTYPIANANNRRTRSNSPRFVTKSDNQIESEIRISDWEPVIVHHLNDSSPLNNSINQRVGFPALTNVFLLQSGNWNVTGAGGGSENSFILEDISVQGFIRGIPEARNLLVLGKLDSVKLKINLRLNSNLDNLVLNGESVDLIKIKFENVRNFLGRENKADEVIAGCDTEYINGRGGSPENTDSIIIPDSEACAPNLRIVVNDATSVLNSARRGNFFYEIRTIEQFQIPINYSSNSAAVHHFLHTFSLIDISNLSVQLDTKELLIVQFSTYNYSHQLRPLSPGELFFSQPIIMTADGSEIKIGSDGTIVAIIQSQNPGGNNTLYGLQFAKNIFKINSSVLLESAAPRRYIGGDLDDLFVLSLSSTASTGQRSDDFPGTIDGFGGSNSLTIEDTSLELSSSNWTIRLNLQQEKLLLEEGVGRGGRKLEFDIQNIQNIHGRDNGRTDEIIANCNTSYISRFSIITIPEDKTCNYSLTIEISDTTIIHNEATQGDFNYKFQTLRSFDVDFHNTSSINHIFILSLTLNDFEKLTYDKNQSRIVYSVASVSGDSYTHKLQDIDPTSDLFHFQPKIFTADKAQLKISRWGNTFISQVSDKSVSEILDTYPNIANRLNATISITTQYGGQTIAILVGNIGAQRNILRNKEGAITHLTAPKNSQNIFQIIPTTEDVYIHLTDIESGTPPQPQPAAESGSLLDLSEIIVPIRKKKGTMYSPEIVEENFDLIFVFDEFRVVFVNGLADHGFLKVVLDVAVTDLSATSVTGASRSSVRAKRSLSSTASTKWKLQQLPLVIPVDSDIVVLTSGDLEPGTQIQMMQNSEAGNGGSGSLKDFEFLKMNRGAVMMTNLGHTGQNPVAVVFMDTPGQVFRMEDLSINFTHEHREYDLSLVTKVGQLKTFEELRSDVQDNALREVYPVDEEFSLSLAILAGILAFSIVLITISVILYLWRRRSRHSYVVTLIERYSCCSKSKLNEKLEMRTKN